MLRRRKRLLVDLDNTVLDLYGEWLGVYNHLYNQNIQKADIKTWDIHDHVPHGGEIYNILEIPGFYQRPKPMSGAIKAIETISDAVHVVICTAAHAGHLVVADKMLWIKHHMPFIPLKDIMPIYHKDWVKADGLLDDGPHNITKYHEAWPDAQIWSMRWPYNEHLSGIAKMYEPDVNFAKPDAFWKKFVPDVLEWSQG